MASRKKSASNANNVGPLIKRFFIDIFFLILSSFTLPQWLQGISAVLKKDPPKNARNASVKRRTQAPPRNPTPQKAPAIIIKNINVMGGRKPAGPRNPPDYKKKNSGA